MSSNECDNSEFPSGKEIYGTCIEMCPQQEVTLRTQEKMVHVLEVTPSGRKLVKSFYRSAADSYIAKPELLRPYNILLQTLNYLLFEVTKRKDVQKIVMYDFLNDRIRAIRQDMTIQRLPPEECIVLLDPMIRFYVYFGYRLSELPYSSYDPVLNRKYLLECIKWFLSCCDDIDRCKKDTSDIDNITSHFNALNVNKSNARLATDQVLIESLYIMCNLDDVHPLYRYLQLPERLKRASPLKLAYNVAIANLIGNYVKVKKLSNRLCPLTYAALCLHLPTLQRRGLKIISHAYHSKQLSVPVAAVREWLAFNTDEEVRSVCKHYGLKADSVVWFNKGDFKDSCPLPPTKRNYAAKILQLKLEDVLFYTL